MVMTIMCSTPSGSAGARGVHHIRSGFGRTAQAVRCGDVGHGRAAVLHDGAAARYFPRVFHE